MLSNYKNVVTTCWVAALAVGVSTAAFAQTGPTIPELVDFAALYDAGFTYLAEAMSSVMTFLMAITVAWKAYSYFARA